MGIHEMALVSSKSAMNQILLSKGVIFANRPNFPRYDIIFGGDRENSLALCSWSNVHKDRRKFCKRGVIPVAGTNRHQQLEDSINIFVQQYIQYVQANSQVVRKKDILYLTSDIFMDFLCKKSYRHDDIEYEQFVDGCDYVFWDINHCYLIDFLPFLTSFGISFFYLKHLKKVTDYLRLVLLSMTTIYLYILYNESKKVSLIANALQSLNINNSYLYLLDSRCKQRLH